MLPSNPPIKTLFEDKAFPFTVTDSPDQQIAVYPGITKREYFAALAMQAMVTRTSYAKDPGATGFAVIYADALIEALNSGKIKEGNTPEE